MLIRTHIHTQKTVDYAHAFPSTTSHSPIKVTEKVFKENEIKTGIGNKKQYHQQTGSFEKSVKDQKQMDGLRESVWQTAGQDTRNEHVSLRRAWKGAHTQQAIH